MTRIDVLRKNYQRVCEYSWDRNVAGPSGSGWPSTTRKTSGSCGSGWGCSRRPRATRATTGTAIDLTDAFADWMCGRRTTPTTPRAISSRPNCSTRRSLAGFQKAVVAGSSSAALRPRRPARTRSSPSRAWPRSSASSRFRSSCRWSRTHIRGRLLVFFPGVYEQNNYRLLDARDGWNYHAVPITASDGGGMTPMMNLEIYEKDPRPTRCSTRAWPRSPAAIPPPSWRPCDTN